MRYKFLVDIHCDRIVYFTSNIAEHTEIDENLYVCFYDGDLPKTPREMTLKNCWSWKWDAVNDKLNYANQEITKQTTLFDQNKQAAKQVLINVINKARKNVITSYAFDAYVQVKIYEELSKPNEEQFYINSIVEITGNSKEHVLEEYHKKKKRFEDILFLSEITRLHFEKAIDECKTSDQLYTIRNNIAATNILEKYKELEN